MSDANNINIGTSASSVIKLLECPICLETITVPICQCFNGHLVCQTCIKDIKNCPICRDELPTKPIRNLALETMTEHVEFDCRNHGMGCQAKLKQKDFKDHSYDCPYDTSDFCNLLSLQNLIQSCHKRIKRSEILDHMKTHHKLKGVYGNKAEVVQNMTNFNQSLLWVPVYFHVNDTTYFLTGGYSQEEELAYWNCVIAGSSKAAKDYQVQLSLASASPKIRITWDGPVIGIEKAKNEIQKSSFTVAKKSLETFCRHDEAQHPLTAVASEWRIQVIIKKLPLQSRSVPNTNAPESYPSLGSLSIALNSSVSSSSTGGNNAVVHNGVTCDGCATRNFTGVRYKCLECVDYDLCATCNRKGLHNHHILCSIATHNQRTKAYDVFRALGFHTQH